MLCNSFNISELWYFTLENEFVSLTSISLLLANELVQASTSHVLIIHTLTQKLIKRSVDNMLWTITSKIYGDLFERLKQGCKDKTVLKTIEKSDLLQPDVPCSVIPVMFFLPRLL